MAISNTIPSSTNGTNNIQLDEYSSAIQRANKDVDVFLNPQGKLQIHDKTSTTTKAEFSFYNTNTDDFSGFNLLDNKIIATNTVSKSSSLTFQANNTVTADDPHLDIFHQMDEMIEAVRNGMTRANGENEINVRNRGIQNSIALLDHIYSHITEVHTKVGAQSKMLEYSIERSEVLLINVQTTKSQILDTDFGEASMRFKQLELNYQAVLATIGKINNLSMVNYYK
jgi:flagellar hook-associated protein 3 FlgL